MTADVPPPTGRVALVFTDVVGSAELWEHDPTAMREAISHYDAVFSGLLEEWDGYAVRTVGDAHLLVWSHPAKAVRWCVALQERLLEVPWPSALLAHPEAAVVQGESGPLFAGLRVRVGMHVGTPQTQPHEANGTVAYSGPEIRRAGRLADAAHGGQILLSAAAWSAARVDVQDEVVALECGEHRLRGLGGTVRVIDVRSPRLLERTLPPLRTVSEARTNLVPDVNALVGRQDDLSALRELYGFGVRLATVLGPPGVGKSRLCREFASRNLSRWATPTTGGVWVCDVSFAHTVNDVVQIVGSALNVPLTEGRSAADSIMQLGHAMAARGTMLVVLDGFESVAGPGRDALLQWLRLAPDVRFLVTSGDRLRLEREVAYELSPFDVPREAGLQSCAPVELLDRRLKERGEAECGSGGGGAHCVALVELAGGLPLAIEMLSGVAGPLSAAQIEEDVGARLAHVVHPTTIDRLGAVFDASLSRLRPWERGALARCSVFRGGFDLESAEEVLDLSEWAGAPWVGDVLERLRELGMIRATQTPSSPGTYRFDLHPFVREAVQIVFPAHDRAPTVERHAQHYVKWGRSWAEQVHGETGTEALARLDQERQNLTVVVSNCLATRPLTAARVELALKAGAILDPLFAVRGPFSCRLELLDDVLHSADAVAGVDPVLIVRSLRNRAEAMQERGRWIEARADIDRALLLARAAGHTVGEVAVQVSLGLLLRRTSQLDQALHVYDGCLARARKLGLDRIAGLAEGGRGVVLHRLGRHSDAAVAFESAIAALSGVGDRRNEGFQLGNLGVVTRQIGRLRETEDLYWRALDIHRETGDRQREGMMLGNLGVLKYHRGSLDSALHLYKRAVEVDREVGNRRSEAAALANIGLVHMERDELEAAWSNFHEALALNRDVGDVVGEGCDLGFLGVHQHFIGEFDKATESYRRALELLQRSGNQRFLGSYSSWAAACAADLGKLDRAEQLFEWTESILATSGDPHLPMARDVLLASLDLARARRSAEQGDKGGAKSAIETARERLEVGRGRVAEHGSGDLRLALKWLERRLAAPA